MKLLLTCQFFWIKASPLNTRFKTMDHFARGITCGQQLHGRFSQSARYSGGIWSRLSEDVMPLIVPEQTFIGDQQIGQKAGA
ncbi:hypothetical protein C1890_09565 [Pseudomonas sp. DP16D-R1]|jgi:hypothetical protein|nr:hypothetical protein C1890_09565 [Pseudomonas sp. DP16D-R1]